MSGTLPLSQGWIATVGGRGRFHLGTSPSSSPTLPLKGGGGGVDGQEVLDLSLLSHYVLRPVSPKVVPDSPIDEAQTQLFSLQIFTTGGALIYKKPGFL